MNMRFRRVALAVLTAACALAHVGCGVQDMVVQPKVKPLQPSAFFDDGQSARPAVPGTVAIGHLGAGARFDTGEVDGKLVPYIPLSGFDPDEKLAPEAARDARKTTLIRGRERFNIYCAPCHGQTGEGNGMIVQRGFSRPPSFHDPSLRAAPPGHYYRAITQGYGAMYSYASRINPADRWAIVAYIRALQWSQNPPRAEVAAR